MQRTATDRIEGIVHSLLVVIVASGHLAFPSAGHAGDDQTRTDAEESASAPTPPLDAEGRKPTDEEATRIRDAICRRAEAPDACRSEQLEVRRIYEGAFSGNDDRERIVSLSMADDHRSTALLRSQEGELDVAGLFPATDTDRCLRFADADGHHLLVCHRTVEDDVWRTGFFYTLRFDSDGATRRQLATYSSNARGCPRDVLQTEHPTGWGAWRVSEDPRPPLVWFAIQHRNGRVPAEFDDACDAMNHGRRVFGPRRRRVLDFELRNGRFRRVDLDPEPHDADENAPTDSPNASGRTDRGSTHEFCRTEDVRQTLAKAQDDVRACYAGELEKRPTSKGDLVMKWTIERDGSVSDVSIADDDFQGDSRSLADCIARRLQRLEFTKPRGGTCVVEYPYSFAHE